MLISKWALAVSFCFASMAFAENAPTNITTASGLVYTNCRITRTEPDGITIMSAKGIAKIAFTNLPTDVQAVYNYDPTNAAKYARKVGAIRADAAKEAQALALRSKTEQEVIPECRVTPSSPSGIHEPGTRYFTIRHNTASIRFEEKELQSVISALRAFLKLAEKVEATMPDLHKPLLERSYVYMRRTRKHEVLGLVISKGRPFLQALGRGTVEDATALLKFLEQWSAAKWDANMARTKSALQ